MSEKRKFKKIKFNKRKSRKKYKYIPKSTVQNEPDYLDQLDNDKQLLARVISEQICKVFHEEFDKQFDKYSERIRQDISTQSDQFCEGFLQEFNKQSESLRQDIRIIAEIMNSKTQQKA